MSQDSVTRDYATLLQSVSLSTNAGVCRWDSANLGLLVMCRFYHDHHDDVSSCVVVRRKLFINIDPAATERVVLGSVVVSTSAWHTAGRGSITRQGTRLVIRHVQKHGSPH